MSAPAEQLQFVWHAARCIAMCSKYAAAESLSAEDAATRASALDGELGQLRSLRAAILDQLPEEQVSAWECPFCIWEMPGQINIAELPWSTPIFWGHQ
jgi:hypothetical protein